LLKQFDIGSNDADTIMHYAKNNVYLLNVKDYGFLGEYKNQFVFTKGQSLSGYKIETGKLIFSHSNKSIGLITPGEYSSGWFLVKNHHTIPVLPKLDSIRSLVHIKYVHYFIHEENGVFTVFKDSKLIQKESYGSFFREKKYPLENDFDYGIYRLENRKLVKVNRDGRKLLDQVGLYFVPLPGFKAFAVWNIDEIFNSLDSVLIMQSQPKQIEIK